MVPGRRRRRTNEPLSTGGWARRETFCVVCETRFYACAWDLSAGARECGASLSFTWGSLSMRRPGVCTEKLERLLTRKIPKEEIKEKESQEKRGYTSLFSSFLFCVVHVGGIASA